MEKKEKDRRKTGLLLSILGVVSLVLITAGVTYAFFSYAKEGQTENVITTGTIRFAYDETQANGDGILIQDALPVTDAVGMAQTGAGKVFDFTVTSVTPSTAKIPYVVTVKKDASSTLANDQVKLYLVAGGDESGNGETVDNSVVATFASLPELTADPITNDIANDNERILFTSEVPASSSDYEATFTLKMWLNGDVSNTSAEYSPYEFMETSVAGATGTKTFTITAGSCSDGVSTEANCTGEGKTWTPAVTATAPSATNTTAIKAEDQIRAGKFITSTAYYALPATGAAAHCSDNSGADEASCTGTWVAATKGRDSYERIAYVNETDKTVYTRSQAVALNNATVDQFGNYTLANVQNFTKTEQYYQINGQSFSVKVNVYAEGAKVTN